MKASRPTSRTSNCPEAIEDNKQNPAHAPAQQREHFCAPNSRHAERDRDSTEQPTRRERSRQRPTADTLASGGERRRAGATLRVKPARSGVCTHPPPTHPPEQHRTPNSTNSRHEHTEPPAPTADTSTQSPQHERRARTQSTSPEQPAHEHTEHPVRTQSTNAERQPRTHPTRAHRAPRAPAPNNPEHASPEQPEHVSTKPETDNTKYM